jgi:hypothetical protein
MARLDLFALLRTHYTAAEPPTTKETEPDAETARKAKRFVVRERDLRELLALATTEAVTRANELISSRYPAGSMHCTPLIGMDDTCAAWLRLNTPKAEEEIAKYESVVPQFDELQTYASDRT